MYYCSIQSFINVTCHAVIVAVVFYLFKKIIATFPLSAQFAVNQYVELRVRWHFKSR